MSIGTTVVTPKVGMAVTWIDPNLDPLMEGLIKMHGQGDFRVRSVTERRQLPGKNRWLVSLERDGQPVLDQWDDAFGPKPENFQPMLCKVSWHYLEPVK